MTRTLKLIYRTRLLLFTATAVVLTLSVWLLLTDLMFRYALAGTMLWYLRLRFGFWPAIDHGLRGLMGVYMEGKGAHAAATVAVILLFFASQLFFLRPGRGWMPAMLARGRPHLASVLATAMSAALLTVGLAALVLQVLGVWTTLPGHNLKTMGFILAPSFWVAMPTLFVGWLVWAALLRARWRGGDGYSQLAQALYFVFVAAGLELLIGGLLEAHGGFVGEYWRRGTFTTSLIGAAGLLWTLAPGVTLVYAIQRYSDGQHRVPSDLADPSAE